MNDEKNRQAGAQPELCECGTEAEFCSSWNQGVVGHGDSVVAGAQGPSLFSPDEADKTGLTWSEYKTQKIQQLQVRLKAIQDYATEAAKTPITRESIAAAPQVDLPAIPDDLKAEYDSILLEAADNGGEFTDEEQESRARLIERVGRAEAEVEARKLHELAQFDEMQGLRRRILSESVGGK